jgi:hypothetical protein
MLMPEATANLDDRSVLRKHKVRSARQPPVMEAVPQASMMEKSPYRKFRLRVAAANSSHHTTPRRLINDVSHFRS